MKIAIFVFREKITSNDFQSKKTGKIVQFKLKFDHIKKLYMCYHFLINGLFHRKL